MPILNWIGKDKVINHHQDVPYRVLDRKYTHGANADGNMIIHGDNLDALKSLLTRYEGRVKLVYIDPPYNTGNEGWVYNDNVNDPKMLKWLGEVVGKEGEDLSRHDKWLCMMYPRLRLLQRILADDGAIFISIDDNEQTNLKLICDEIFGNGNFVANIVWQKRIQPEMRTPLGSAHAYLTVYAKNTEIFMRPKHLLPPSEEQRSRYTNSDNDPKGAWVSADFMAKGWRPNQMYEIITPAGKKYAPREGSCWRNIESVYQALVQDGRIYFGKNGDAVPRRKTYLSETEGIAAWTWWSNKEVLARSNKGSY
jgi:adenine-specific DNA-methyltransferase